MGYGDDFIATAQARVAKEKNPNSRVIIGDGNKIYPSIVYLNNPNIYQGEISVNDTRNIWIKNYINNRPYIDQIKTNRERIYFNNNFSPTPGDIFFSKEEDMKGLEVIKTAKKIWETQFKKISKFVVMIEPNVKGPDYANNVGSNIVGEAHLNRDWGFEKWQEVVNNLKDQVAFIQCFKGKTKKLTSVIEADCNFRMAVSIMKNCDLFVGTNGGLIQAAAAINKPAINILGGWISPKVIGYKTHENFYIDDKKSPCGARIRCQHCAECMSQIKVDEVILSILKILNK